MGREIGSTTKPIYVNTNGDAKPCDLPANATQLGTDANGGIVAISTATTSSTVRCYISPDQDYWKTVNNGISTATLSTIRAALGMAKIVVDGKEVDGDPFIGNPSISYVVMSGKYYFVGIDTGTQLNYQLKAHHTNRVFFPLFSVGKACQFLANFRTQTLAQKYEICCTRGIYLYTESQTVAHVDVSNGGVSEIIITGMPNDSSLPSVVQDNEGKMTATEYTEALRVKEFSIANNDILSINNSTNTGASPYRVTFVRQWDSSNPLSCMFRCYGTVHFKYVNFMYGDKSQNPSDASKYIYKLVTPTQANWIGKHNTGFVSAVYCYVKFRSVWCNTGTYVCFDADRIDFASEPVSSTADNNIVNVHLKRYPIQINSSILTPMFGCFDTIYVNTGTYLRVIAKQQVSDPNGNNFYNAFRALFAIRKGLLQIARSSAEPTRMDVRCEHYSAVFDGVRKYNIFTLLEASANTGLNWPSDSVHANTLIKNNRDAVAIYWYGKVQYGGINRDSITDCIPLLTTNTAITGTTYAVWTSVQQSNMNGFLNDGKELFNRWIHFTSYLNSSSSIQIDASDFQTGDNAGIRAGFSGNGIYVHPSTTAY